MVPLYAPDGTDLKLAGIWSQLTRPTQAHTTGPPLVLLDVEMDATIAAACCTSTVSEVDE